MGKYFSMAELTFSSVARAKGIDNTPPPQVAVKLQVLIRGLLDPVRLAYGSPIRINSGFRCPVLNKAIGGAINSQHTKGEAADLQGGDRIKNKRLFDLIRTGPFNFDQLINEQNYSWIHVSYKACGNRKQVLSL